MYAPLEDLYPTVEDWNEDLVALETDLRFKVERLAAGETLQIRGSLL